MYLDILLPTGVDLAWTGGFGFSTPTAIMANGKEARNQEWAYNRSRYRVSYNARLPAAWLEFEAFFGLAAGMANTWRLRDPRDNFATSAMGKLVAIDGTHSQMVKRYTFGAYSFDTPVTKPAATGISFTGGGGVSYDVATGIVTHGAAPTAWSGTFYKHCRFDTDVLELDGLDKSGGQLIAGWRDVPIVEVTLE